MSSVMETYIIYIEQFYLIKLPSEIIFKSYTHWKQDFKMFAFSVKYSQTGYFKL